MPTFHSQAKNSSPPKHMSTVAQLQTSKVNSDHSTIVAIRTQNEVTTQKPTIFSDWLKPDKTHGFPWKRNLPFSGFFLIFSGNPSTDLEVNLNLSQVDQTLTDPLAKPSLRPFNPSETSHAWSKRMAPGVRIWSVAVGPWTMVGWNHEIHRFQTSIFNSEWILCFFLWLIIQKRMKRYLVVSLFLAVFVSSSGRIYFCLLRGLILRLGRNCTSKEETKSKQVVGLLTTSMYPHWN